MLKEPIINNLFPTPIYMTNIDREFTKKWAEDKNKKFSINELIDDEEFIKVIKQTTERVNKQLAKVEQIRKFLLIDKEFTIENEMMTPTMKVRRFMVKLNYKNQLEELY